MADWNRIDFTDPDFASMVGVCRETAIEKWVNAAIQIHGMVSFQFRLKAWEFDVSNGSMTLFGATSSRRAELFFTNFHCGSKTPLSGPVRLTFKNDILPGFSHIHFMLSGPPDPAGAPVNYRIGSGASATVPENGAGVLQPVLVDLGSGRANSLTIESTRAELNLIELSWIPADMHLKPGHLLPG